MARSSRSGGSRPSGYWKPWSAAMAEAFGLGALGSGWTPPAQVRVSPGSRRMTFSARFTNQAGQVMTARLRCARDGAGEWFVTSSELDQRCVFEVKA
jgi:hypothetical protein